MDVAPKALLAHLQVGFTGCRALDLMVLNTEIQRYHLEVEGISKYINMLEEAQKQAGRAGLTIADKTLLLFASTTMLMMERYPRTNNYWEDRSKEGKTWADWKTAYNRAHAKARVKAQAAEGSDKFGAPNSAEMVLTTNTG